MLKQAFLLITITFVMSCGVSNAQSNSDNDYGSGVHQYFSGQHQEAIMSLNTAIMKDSSDARAYYFRGLARMASGDTYSAESDFRQGAMIEGSTGKRSSLVSRSLERIQGGTRLTLEKIRKETIMGPVQPSSIAVANAYPMPSAPIAYDSQPVIQQTYASSPIYTPQTYVQPIAQSCNQQMIGLPIVSQPIISQTFAAQPVMNQPFIHQGSPGSTIIIDSVPAALPPTPAVYNTIVATPAETLKSDSSTPTQMVEQSGTVEPTAVEQSVFQSNVTPKTTETVDAKTDVLFSDVKSATTTPAPKAASESMEQPEVVFGSAKPVVSKEESSDNSFGSEPAASDPFGAEPATTTPDNSFSAGAATAEPEPVVSETTTETPDDPFGAEPVASDPFGAEPAAEPKAETTTQDDPFGAETATAVPSEEPVASEPATEKSDDPFGAETTDDPFGADTTDNDPFGASETATESGGSSVVDDPFGQ